MNDLIQKPESATSFLLNVDSMSQITKFSELMSEGRCMIPAHFHNAPADCMAVVMQSLQWNMNPFVVAQKTHLVNGTLGYEAQLINAVISSSTTIKGRFKYEYGGDWEALAGKVKKDGKNVYKTWSDSQEIGLWCRVGAMLKGDDDITWGEKVFFGSVITRNSPLWVTNPRQQIAYLAVKYWSRLYTPDVILGVYDKDDLLSRDEKVGDEKEINPISAKNLNASLSSPVSSVSSPSEQKEESEPIATIIENEPVSVDAIDDLDLIHDHLLTVKDKTGYIEATEMYMKAKNSGKYTPEKLKVIADEISNKHSELKSG